MNKLQDKKKQGEKGQACKLKKIKSHIKQIAMHKPYLNSDFNNCLKKCHAIWEMWPLSSYLLILIYYY